MSQIPPGRRVPASENIRSEWDRESKRLSGVFDRRGVRHRAKDHANRIAWHQAQNGENGEGDEQNKSRSPWARRRARKLKRRARYGSVPASGALHTADTGAARVLQEVPGLPLREILRGIFLTSFHPCRQRRQLARTPNQIDRSFPLTVLRFAERLCRRSALDDASNS